MYERIRRLRAPAAIAALVLASQAATYTVEWGDTLSRIARKFGIGVSALADANGLRDPDFVRAGRTLSIPSKAAAAPAPAGAPMKLVSSASGTTTHEVRPGETLSGIALRYGTSVSALVELNGLADPHHVVAGRVLSVPSGSAQSAAAPVWRCPVQGADRWSFIDSFGAPRPGGRRHLGIDLFARRGTPVLANVGGTLEHVSGSVAGYAYYLTGDDGFTYYGAHLHGYARGPGRVEVGEPIGYVGTTGNAAGTPAHLHFSMARTDGTHVNPYSTLRGAC